MNTPKSRDAALKQMKKILEGVTPRFENVLVGEPKSVGFARSVYFWFDGEEPAAVGSQTLGNAMVCQRFMVRAYYQLPGSAEEAEALELQIWNDSRAVQAAFAWDSTLGGNVTDLEIDLQSADWAAFDDGSQFRTLTWSLRLEELEAEGIRK